MLPNAKSSESQLFYGCDMNGNYLLLKFTRFQHRIAELWITLRLEDGTHYTLPGNRFSLKVVQNLFFFNLYLILFSIEHPDTRVGNATPNRFEAHGLSMEILVPYSKWRICFSGLLRRGVRKEYTEHINESELEYVKFNFLWTACSPPKHWPYDWSPKLMATALAIHPWKDGNWKHMLKMEESGGFDQFGALHGQIFLSENSKIDFGVVLSTGQIPFVKTIELHLPGLRQRRWGPTKVWHLHRTATFIGVLKTGVVFELGAISSKYGLSQ